MQRLDGGDALQVSVVAGMIVWPGNGAGFPIVGAPSTRIGLAIFWIVKKVCRPDPVDPPKPLSHVLVVAGRQQPTALGVKAVDGITVAPRESAATVDAEDPQLVEVRPADFGQDGVVAPVRLEISGSDSDEVWNIGGDAVGARSGSG